MGMTLRRRRHGPYEVEEPREIAGGPVFVTGRLPRLRNEESTGSPDKVRSRVQLRQIAPGWRARQLHLNSPALPGQFEDQIQLTLVTRTEVERLVQYSTCCRWPMACSMTKPSQLAPTGGCTSNDWRSVTP